MFKTLISTQQLHGILASPQLKLFDCRFSLSDPHKGFNDYRQSHIPGALYASLDKHLSSPPTRSSGRHPLPSTDLLTKFLSQSGVDAGSQIVVYDDMGGAIAARMWWLMKWLGHEAVSVLDGGFPVWLAHALETDCQEADLPSANYGANGDNSLWVETLEVIQQLGKDENLLLDARAEERFSGKVEPLDKIAGHIPGAVNRPLNKNLSSEGTFRSAQKLKADYQALLGSNVSADQVIHMCGSGVTACHNLLAMEHAGLTGSRLYVGSWSEWVQDTRRPISTSV